MIGIDTNILLRLWLDDDPVQSERIDALLAEHGGTPGSKLSLMATAANLPAGWQAACGRNNESLSSEQRQRRA